MQAIGVDELRSQLNQIRLEEDLTYSALAAHIGLREHSGLHRFLNSQKRQPTDRTLHKIRRFLNERRVPRRGRLQMAARHRGD
jgi:secreted Zn-dependent insulinase-like peptidase